jgi:hypothetical protein
MRRAILSSAILAIDRVLAAGKWDSGRDLTPEDVLWLRALTNNIIAKATFGPVP